MAGVSGGKKKYALERSTFLLVFQRRGGEPSDGPDFLPEKDGKKKKEAVE